jgi:peptidoglycan-associated lipoprotein
MAVSVSVCVAGAQYQQLAAGRIGKRRAQVVRRALALQGVQESQVATVSYGEERPAAAGSDETAYSKNRRVEIVYIN